MASQQFKYLALIAHGRISGYETFNSQLRTYFVKDNCRQYDRGKSFQVIFQWKPPDCVRYALGVQKTFAYIYSPNEQFVTSIW